MPVVEPISSFETNVRCKGNPGRPPQPGERYPSGRLKPADKREVGPAPALIERAFDKALRGGGEPHRAADDMPRCPEGWRGFSR